MKILFKQDMLTAQEVGKFLLLEVSGGGKKLFSPKQEAELGEELKS